MSADIEPTDVDGPHHQGDVTPLLRKRWDMVIAFPPCTHLATVQPGRLTAQKLKDGRVAAALEMVYQCYGANAPRVAVENPQGLISTIWRRPDQYIEPWMWGHPHTKKTGLWLRGLPPLLPDCSGSIGHKPWVNSGRGPQYHGAKSSAKDRAQTFQGVADAMASQWG